MAIRAKLVIIVLVFAILPMFLLTARWKGTAEGTVALLLSRGLDNRAQEISQQIDRALDRHRTQMRQLTGRAPLLAYARNFASGGQAQPETQLRQELGAFLLTYHYTAIIWVNRSGLPIFRIESGQEPDGAIRAYFKNKDFAGEDALQDTELLSSAAPDTVLVSELITDADGPHVRLIAPLRDPAGQIVSALIAKLPADLLLTEAIGPRGPVITSPSARATTMWREVIVLDREGTILYSADKTKQGRSYREGFSAFAEAFAAILSGASNSSDRYRVFNEEWIIRSLKHQTSPQLSILVLERYSGAVEGLEWAGLTMFLLTFVLAIVATLLLYYFISGTTISIQRVTRGAKAIAAGNLDHQIKVKSNDETRVLADAFNRMAARLREMIAKEAEQKQFESFARLSAVLTHDLKNAILSLSLLVTNMERKFDRESFREDALRTLSESVDNLQNLVAKLSDPLAQTGGIKQAEDLSAIVEGVLARTAAQAGERYQIIKSLLPRLSAEVERKAIERVIENLIINALEAMPDGGTLRVTTRVENEEGIIAVADTGKGMTEEFMRNRLFHPFATTKKKGIGLGLYSCRDIVEKNGGRIEVSSKVNVGTEFRIILPLAPEPAKVREEQTAYA